MKNIQPPLLTRQQKTPKRRFSELLIDGEDLEKIKQRIAFENKWGEAEKIRQNKEMKRLYERYKGFRVNNTEENLSEKDNKTPSE